MQPQPAHKLLRRHDGLLAGRDRPPISSTMSNPLSLHDAAVAAMLEEAIVALRGAGHVVHPLETAPAMYCVDGWPPISSRAVIVLAFEVGLMASDGALH